MSGLVGTALCRDGDGSQLAGNSSAAWALLDGAALRDPGICQEIRKLMQQSGDLLLHHDPIWLGVGAGETPDTAPLSANAFYVCRRNGLLIGYAPFTSGSRALRFAVGELILHRHRLRSFTLVHDIVAVGGGEMRLALTRELLDVIRRRLRPGEGVFLEGVPTDSALFQAVSAPASGRSLLTVRLGDACEHQFARLPDNFRDYEAQLGSNSRKKLRWGRKKLMEHVSGELRTARFTEMADVAQFVADAQKISRATYQWRLLGLGLRNAAGLTATLVFAARNGWLRSYILYCRGEPVAFMLGYHYCRTYYYMDVGYDPDWSKWGVGSILQIEVMKDLLGDPNRPEIFDFSTGIGEHKTRFGNSSRSEINLLLLKNCPRNALLAAAFTATAAVDKQLRKSMERLGVKASLKRWLRRRA